MSQIQIGSISADTLATLVLVLVLFAGLSVLVQFVQLVQSERIICQLGGRATRSRIDDDNNDGNCADPPTDQGHHGDHHAAHSPK